MSEGTAITVCLIWPKISEKLSCLDPQWIKHGQHEDNPTARAQNLKADLEIVLRGVVGQRFRVQYELRDEHGRLTGGFGEGGLESKQNIESKALLNAPWCGSIMLTSAPVHLLVCGVRLTPALDGTLTESLLEDGEHVGRRLHHQTVKGAGDQIVHETDEATRSRRSGSVQRRHALHVAAGA